MKNNLSIETQHKDEINRIVSYNNDKSLATASDDKEIHIYQTDNKGSWEYFGAMKGHTDSIYDLTKLNNG